MRKNGNGYRRSKENRRRLKKLYESTKNSYGAGAWFSDRKQRYIRYAPSNTPGYTKYLRRISNRKVRHRKELLNHGAYKKAFDYWWTLF